MFKKLLIITFIFLFTASGISSGFAAESETPSKDNLWNYNYCKGKTTPKKEGYIDFVKAGGGFYSKGYSDYNFDEDGYYEEETDFGDGYTFIDAKEPITVGFASTVNEDEFASIGCSLSDQASYFEMWFDMPKSKEKNASILAEINPKTWEVEIYNNQYIDPYYDPDSPLYRPNGFGDLGFGESITFDLIIKRRIPSSENWDDGELKMNLYDVTLDINEGFKFKIHDDPMGGITILEANTKSEFIPEFERNARSHNQFVEFPVMEINPSMSNIVLQPDVPRMSQFPKMEIAFDEKQEDGSIKKVQKIVEGVTTNDLKRVITYVDVNTHISDLMEAAGRLAAETEILGDARLIPEDLQLRFYINDRLQKTVNWTEAQGATLLLNDLSAGTHELKMENYSLSNGGIIWTTQDEFELKQDHSNKLYFTDITELHDLYDEILAAVKEGWINGYPDLTFRPDDPVNRAEFAKMLMIAFNKPEGTGENLGNFPDVDFSQWYRPYLSTAVDLRMMQGYPDGTMKPGNTINKAEALKMTLEILDNIYEEKPNQQWYEKYRSYALDNFNLNFLSVEDMNQDMTRGECVQLILEALGNNA